jgi:hypothetical protein
MAADWSQPTLTTQYATLLAALLARDVDSATMYQATGTPTNVPDKAVRWNPSTNTFEQYSVSGGTWAGLFTAGLSVPLVAIGNAPTAANHATRKDYVDAQVAAVSTVANAALPKTGGTMTGELVINAGAASNVALTPGGVLRYIMGWDGSNYIINRYSATGTYQDTPLYINTATGQVIISQRPAWGSVTPWDTGNLPSPASTNGPSLSSPIFTGSTTLYNTNGSTSYTCYVRADYSGLWGVINQAGNAWNVQVSDNGYVNFPRTRPGWAGVVPWDSGNLNPANYVPVRAGLGGSGYALQSDSHTTNFGWGGTYVNMSVDSTYLGGILTTSSYSNVAAPRTILDTQGVGAYWIRLDTESAPAGSWKDIRQVVVGGNNLYSFYLSQRVA